MSGIMLFITVLQVLSAVAIVVLVLLQHGKGADMGAAFGSGSSGSLFGASGASNFLSRSTAIAAVLFFTCTLILVFNANQSGSKGVLENYKSTPAKTGSTNQGTIPTPAANTSVQSENKTNQIPQ